ncbi:MULTISPECIES: LacI family DNA-binding transcriptional regulator [Microbacterium]|jgi:DNA-binding LacI/PurR family transcriptional regulator|uniref:LacI family DNA-binding transcriptional regulator n=1 Tax=Microbacterium TaxID=33882 RepID=UPI0010F8377D|nr:LacI family DNA-binding transcriptional regulator [Microbacterium sp. 4NA327F11]MCK9915024.1 LacI family transcriptional regulator [Microbacteriaceae bacterium K1510]
MTGEDLRSPTLQEVATAARVSLATASNALTGNRGVSVALRDRVLDAAQRLGYPRAQARARRTDRITVGIILPDVRHPAYAELAHAFEREGQRRDWSLVLSVSDFTPAVELDALESLVRSTDGVLLSPSRPPRSGVHMLQASPVPIVACDEPADSPLIGGWVRSDDFGGGRLAAHHLHDAGGTRFAMIGGHGYLPSTHDRREGFLAGLRDRGVAESDVLIIGDAYGMDGGQDAMAELLETDDTVDAVFAVSDMHAVGALFRALQEGRRVPEDILLCGFDGVAWTRQITPTITTIKQDWERIAVRAMDMLDTMMNGGDGARAILPVELVVGASSTR